MSTSAKGKKSYADQVAEKYATKTRTREETSAETKEVADEKFANIDANPFYKIIQSEASPREMKKLIAKELAYEVDKPKEENEAKIAAFEEFKEYLMAYRKEVSKEIIKLSDTEAFGELQRVFEDMNASLLDFENQIGPLVEMIDAVNRLNLASDGAMYDVFQEIQKEREEEERLAKQLEEQSGKLDEYKGKLNQFERDIASEKTKKKWFGLGGITEEAKQAIAAKEVDIKNQKAEIEKLVTEMEEAKARGVQIESKYTEYAAEKEQLRQLLDLTSDEHKERQEALVEAALHFVNTTDERTGSVLKHMEGIKDQIGNVDGVNSKMKKIFATVTEGVKEAEDMNKALGDQFNAAAEGESELDRYEREDRLQAVNEHVEVLNTSKIDTLSTLGELQQEGVNIKSMRDTNKQQIAQTRKMHSSGTSGVASKLSTVLTAVSAAALNEARTTTMNTLKGMNRITDEIAQGEAIKNATNLHLQNNELTKAIEQLASYREVSDKAREITRTALEEQKDLMRDMEATAEELGTSLKKLKGITADVMQGEGTGEGARVSPAAREEARPEKKNSGIGSFKL